jgi:hypothetical protein
VARGGTSATRELPAPLPPETRTVGQLVAEAIRLYGRRFWRGLSLGILPAAAGVVAAELHGVGPLAFALTGGAVVTTASYIGATLLVAEREAEPRAIARALAAGWLVFLPVPFLASLFILPAVGWLALVGLVVPVALIEGKGIRAALGRAVELGRADYVHAAGSLAALVVVALLSSSVLFFLLRGQGDAALRAAAFLSVLVIAPVIFLGAALLYFDQSARLSVGPASGRMAADAPLPRREPEAPGTVRHASPGATDRGAGRPRHDRR